MHFTFFFKKKCYIAINLCMCLNAYFSLGLRQHTTFTDDPLRVLRAIRFGTRLQARGERILKRNKAKLKKLS